MKLIALSFFLALTGCDAQPAAASAIPAADLSTVESVTPTVGSVKAELIDELQKFLAAEHEACYAARVAWKHEVDGKEIPKLPKELPGLFPAPVQEAFQGLQMVIDTTERETPDGSPVTQTMADAENRAARATENIRATREVLDTLGVKDVDVGIRPNGLPAAFDGCPPRAATLTFEQLAER